MHTTASDGRNSIREMAEAALACGYEYIAITDHSKNLAMTNGLDEKRALEQIKQVHAVDREMEGRIRVFTGIEVDILADGALDLDDEVLAQMDVVIASVHTRFEQSREEMTARVMRAIENPYVRILGHPTGRLLLRREPFALDMAAVLRRAAELGVAMEHNAAPERLDLNDHDLRLAKEMGCRIVMSSDSHDSRNLGKMVYGAKQLRRAWLTAEDVLNTRHAKGFLEPASGQGNSTRWIIRRHFATLNQKKSRFEPTCCQSQIVRGPGNSSFPRARVVAIGSAMRQRGGVRAAFKPCFRS